MAANTITDHEAGRAGSPRTVRRMAAVVLAVASAGVVISVAPDVASARVTEGVSDRAVTADHLIPMKLECAAQDGDVASITCRWSVPDGAASTRLVRVALGTDEGRVTIARFDDPTINSYVDSPVRPGVRYLYVIRAYNEAGRLIGASRPAAAGVPKPSDVEALRLDCSATSTTTVRCAGSTPTVPARVLTLWRSVDGGARERVASFGHPFPETYGDHVPEGTSRVAYALIATDGSDAIVARSRAVHVSMPQPPTDRPVDRPVDRLVDRPVEVDTPSDRPVADVPVADPPAPTSDVAPTEAPQPTVAPERDEPVRDVPVRDEPVRDEPVRDEPVRDVPVRDEPVRDEPTHSDPAVVDRVEERTR